MSMRPTAFASLGSGWFSDVALGDGVGRLIGGFDVPTGIEVRIIGWTGVDVSQTTVLQTAQMIEGTGYSRIYFWQGAFWATYHDGRVAHLWKLPTGDHRVLEPCQNNNPVCFGFGCVAWQGAAAESWPVSRMSLTTGEVVSNVRMGVGTGLSRVLEDGRVVTVDEDRFALPGATQPCFAGDLAVGEGADSGARWRLGSKTGVLWPGCETFTPKCAIAPDPVAITTCGGRDGIRLFCGSRAELLSLISEDPMITDAQMETLKSERAKYPATVTPEQIGAILNATCWIHRNDDNRPGMQRKDSGTHAVQPRTGIGIWNGLRYRDASGQHWGEDVCGGCSVGQFNPIHQTPGPADPATFVAPVEPAASDDLAEVIRRLTALEARVAKHLAD
jgi:hypothetical protein